MKSKQHNRFSMLPDDTQRRGRLVIWTVMLTIGLLLFAMFNGVVVSFLAGAPLRPPDGQPRPSPLVPLVVVIVFFSALITLVRLGRPTISALLLIGSWTLITTLAALVSGVTSFVPALLILPICAAGLLLDGVASLSLAALATLLIIAMAWMEIHGLTLPQRAEPSFITRYRPYIAIGHWVGIFWGVAALTWLFAGGLQRALRQSRTQAQELQQLSAELEARVAAQTAELLSQSREAARYEERTRLARDIHDTLAQGLTGIVVQLGAAQRALTFEPDDAEEHLALAQRMAREALAEARQSVWNLRSPALERSDLQEAIRRLMVRPLGSNIQGRFEQLGSSWPLPPAVEGALLRVVQEGLANVAKHADATTVVVTLSYQPDAVTLSVQDDGRGFTPDVLIGRQVSDDPWSGWGLLGMRERITSLGGSLELHNSEGARIVATIPRHHEEADAGELLHAPTHGEAAWTAKQGNSV